MASPIPPGAIDMLMSGMAPGQPMMGAAEEQPEQNDEDLLRQALAIVRQAIAANGVTDQERLGLEKVTTGIQQILAARDKEQQAAMGGGPATSFLRRITAGG